ncbi:hypothetical protein [Sandarakinorhabdus sp.]|uniref:hypothetical protein n=1 Tax=Sandarakinorhabdus sp. TaxID=1916663 RepID=UPI0033428D23
MGLVLPVVESPVPNHAASGLVRHRAGAILPGVAPCKIDQARTAITAVPHPHRGTVTMPHVRLHAPSCP